ncbi:coiled-coil domain-containing protein 30-like [Ambystoma mexicanum]|uniref:coiled-coil domain-containing protein 30-like n=1 Tax=Ambystoma mexicanum TaxID=8296 RepID=UPI0037E869FC
MEKFNPENVNLEDVRRALKQNGLDPSATADECLRVLWCLYRQSEGRLCSTSQDLHQLKQQQAEEMKDVENYVAHIRMLTEEREIPTSDFEKENELLKSELEQLRLSYDAQQKEVEEMLDQEGLGEIAHSNPNEQVAYLLVERATLLEKLEQSEEKLEPQFGRLREAQLKSELVLIHHTLEEQLQQQRESLQETKETLIRNPWKKLFGLYKDSTSADSSVYDEEFVKEKKLREFVERDLDEAAQRLQMAHAEIRRLTDEIDIKKQEQDTFDSKELQKAKEHNNRLDKEILALRNRVRSLDSERKEYIDLVEKLNKSVNQYQQEKQVQLILPINETVVKPASLLVQNRKIDESSVEVRTMEKKNEQVYHNEEMAHKRCHVQIAERESRIHELMHKLQKIHHEYDELVERNEELESILGETQNERKEEKENFECEIDCLQKKITRLEGELMPLQRNREETNARHQVVATEMKSTVDFQQMFRSEEESLEILESRLATEKQWRQQLESDLQTAQKALMDEKEKYVLLHKCNASKHCIKDQSISLEVKNGSSGSNDNPLKGTPTKSGQLEDLIESLEKEKEQLSLALSESKNKLDTLQRQLYEGMVEKEKLFNENVRLCHDIDDARHELHSKKDETVQLRQELTKVQDQLLNSHTSGDSSKSDALLCQPRDTLLQQQHEEMRQLRQDFHRAQNLCIAAEKEMRHERDKNLCLQKQSNLLQQEITNIKGELKENEQRLANSSQLCSSLEADLAQSRQKIKELELDVLKQQQTSKTQNTLQEKLAQANFKGIDADKRVLELEQQLKDCHHQLRLTEARILQEKRFEDEAKEYRDNEKKVKRQLEEEQLNRKLSDQTVEELQQQIKSLRVNLTSLAQDNTELQFRIQQQESKLRIIDDDQKTTFSEHLDCQSNNHKLAEQLSLVQQEKERLYTEYERVQKQLDEYIRKYNEKQLRHRAKLRRAKEVHVQEIAHYQLHNKTLEGELALIRSQEEKEQVWIRKVTAENETLLQEKRQLLMQISEQEETERNRKWVISSLQSRLHLMDEENNHLQESILRLTTQTGALERILKNIQTLNLEELKAVVPAERLLLAGTSFSVPNANSSVVGQSDSTGSLKAIQDVKFDETANSLKTTFSFSQSPPSEMGYLNVATPRMTAGP